VAELKNRKGMWYARVRWYEDSFRKEKQIPLRTHLKTQAIKRLSKVERKEDDIKDGLAWDFPWLNDEGKTKLKEKSIGETLDEYLLVRKVEGIRQSTVERIEIAMKSLYKLVNEDTRLEALNEQVIERYKRYCKETLNHKPNTINIDLSKIRAFLNWCYRKDYIKKVPFIQFHIVSEEQVNYFSDEMIRQIMECEGIENHYKRAFLFYLETGCRLFEPFNGYVKGCSLVIPPDRSKTHRKREIQLSDLSLAILNEMIDRVDKCIGKRKYAIKNYSRVFKRACRKVQIPERYHFHNLRHTYGVRRAVVTGDIHLVKKEMGHRSVTTTEKYTDFELATLIDDFPTLKKWIEPRLQKPKTDNLLLELVNTSKFAFGDTNLGDTRLALPS